MQVVQCLICNSIININSKVDEMISLKVNNPNILFHPTYYNQCPVCGGKEVTCYDLREETIYRVYCPECGQYSYFKYRKEKPSTTNPFLEYKCLYCGNKQGILMEKRGNKFE